MQIVVIMLLVPSAGASGLDLQAMQAACGHLVGEHDFQHFCKINLANTQVHVRRVITATVEPAPRISPNMPGDLLVLEITGSAFLWHQVGLLHGSAHDHSPIVPACW